MTDPSPTVAGAAPRPWWKGDAFRLSLALGAVACWIVQVLAQGSLHPKWLGAAVVTAYLVAVLCALRKRDAIFFVVSAGLTAASFALGNSLAAWILGLLGAAAGIAGLNHHFLFMLLSMSG